MVFIIIFAYAILFGGVTSLAAKSRNRDPLTWFWIGFVFGIFGLIAVLVMQDGKEDDQWPTQHYSTTSTSHKPLTKKCPDCAEEIKYEAKVCHFCGKRFDEQQKTVTEPIPMKSMTNKEPSSNKSVRLKTTRCPKCYTMNYRDAMFCSACGASINNDD